MAEDDTSKIQSFFNAQSIARASSQGAAIQAAQWADQKLDVFRNAIRSQYVFNAAVLRSASTGLRNMVIEIGQKKIPWEEAEKTCMELICRAIEAGAFSGHEWLVWRTRLAQKPTTSNVWSLLEWQAIQFGHSFAGISGGGPFFYLDRIADEIDKFATPPEPSGDSGPAVTEKNRSGISEIEITSPQFDRDNGQWITNKLAARLDGVKTRTLADYRQDGISNSDGTFGRDKSGRIWRKEGTPNSHPWYLKSSLVSQQPNN